MSVQCSMPSTKQQFQHLWLSSGLICLAFFGCQSVPMRATADRSTPAQLVSNTTSSRSHTTKPEAWQLQKSQREFAVKQAVAESNSHSPTVSGASFEFERQWESSEEPPLFVAGAGSSSWCSECPHSECWPDDECRKICLGCDLDHSLSSVWQDAKGVVNWNNALILAAAGGAAIAMRESHADREVRESVANHPLRWGDGSQFLGKVGSPLYQTPVLLGVYGYSVWSQNDELHDVMGSIFSATTIVGVSTTALKVVADTDRPSKHWMNGELGFPSYHTASTFAIAAVLDEYYGCQVGLPAYALATAIGFSRLDEKEHDLSDVFFGGAMGFVIGKAVAGRHLCGNSKIRFTPYVHPTSGATGLGGEWKF